MIFLPTSHCKLTQHIELCHEALHNLHSIQQQMKYLQKCAVPGMTKRKFSFKIDTCRWCYQMMFRSILSGNGQCISVSPRLLRSASLQPKRHPKSDNFTAFLSRDINKLSGLMSVWMILWRVKMSRPDRSWPKLELEQNHAHSKVNGKHQLLNRPDNKELSEFSWVRWMVDSTDLTSIKVQQRRKPSLKQSSKEVQRKQQACRFPASPWNNCPKRPDLGMQLKPHLYPGLESLKCVAGHVIFNSSIGVLPGA